MKKSYTVGQALHLYEGTGTKDAATIRSILKKLFPDTEAMASPQFAAFLNQLPISTLSATLSPDGSGWAPSVAAELKTRLPVNDTFFKAYPRFVKRFIGFAADAQLTSPPASDFLPEWVSFRELAFAFVPRNKKELQTLLDAGVRRVLNIYKINPKHPREADIKMSNIRSALNGLARAASAAGLTPQLFASEVLLGERHSELGELAGYTIYSSYCRHVWNFTVQAHPELQLPTWADRREVVGKPMEEWPYPLRVGLREGLLARPSGAPLRAGSQKNYRNTLCAFVGILEGLGFHLERLLNDLTPKDAVRLLFQGWPRELLMESAQQKTGLATYQRLLDDSSFREQVLVRMRAQDGQYATAALVENPFVGAVMSARHAEKKYGSSDAIIKRIFTINRDYLAQREGNLSWLVARFEQVDALQGDHETPYDKKKQVIFKHPRLFEQLVRRYEELYRGLVEQDGVHNTAWATFVRDLTYLVLVTLYPLRVSNHAEMILGENYLPDCHVLRFHRSEVKNKKPIEFELPPGGKLAWVRTLVDLYLDEARPILLKGAPSKHFFVGNHAIPNAKPHLVRQAFNDIVNKMCQRHLHDLLPPEIDALNPHMFRHIVATYQIVVHRDRDRAARLLNDTIATIEKHYADLLASSRQECKAFYEGYEVA